MKSIQCSTIRLATIVLFIGFAQVGFAETADIRNAPGGKRLLFVDGDDIRPEPGGKRLLFVDGSDIRPEPGGKRLLFVDGDDVRPAPGGIRLLFIDGTEIRRRPGSKILLHVGHPDIRPDPHGERLMFIDGPKLSKPQLVAVLYQLKPELFKLSAEEEAALKKEFADNAAAEEARLKQDKIPGKYSILTFSSSDDAKAGGEMRVEKKGDFYKLTFKNSKTNETWDGVGYRFKENDDVELWTAFGPQGTAALAIYDADEKTGALNGLWAPAYLLDEPAGFGVEKLAAAGANKYTITEGKAPKTGLAYAGTAEFTPTKIGLNGDAKVFTSQWTMGEFKVGGIGFQRKNKVAIVAGSGAAYHIVRFKLDQGNLIGDFYSSSGANGYYTFGRENE